MPSSQNDNLTRNDIIHALAFAANLYTRIADETRNYSLAVSRYATEIASARTTIAAELATTSDIRLTVDYEDTPDAIGETCSIWHNRWTLPFAKRSRTLIPQLIKQSPRACLSLPTD